MVRMSFLSPVSYTHLDVYKRQVKGHTKFITTRFGNVLGSNGSVIPRFKEQIENGGPVTVTPVSYTYLVRKERSYRVPISTDGYFRGRGVIRCHLPYHRCLLYTS